MNEEYMTFLQWH